METEGDDRGDKEMAGRQRDGRETEGEDRRDKEMTGGQRETTGKNRR